MRGIIISIRAVFLLLGAALYSGFFARARGQAARVGAAAHCPDQPPSPTSPTTPTPQPPTQPPGYIIRSIPTTTTDRVLCKVLAHNAVHAAFAGFTGVAAGLVNTHYVYMPASVVTTAARRVDPRGKQWNRLRATIGQPNFA